MGGKVLLFSGVTSPNQQASFEFAENIECQANQGPCFYGLTMPIRLREVGICLVRMRTPKEGIIIYAVMAAESFECK